MILPPITMTIQKLTQNWIQNLTQSLTQNLTQNVPNKPWPNPVPWAAAIDGFGVVGKFCVWLIVGLALALIMTMGRQSGCSTANAQTVSPEIRQPPVVDQTRPTAADWSMKIATYTDATVSNVTPGKITFGLSDQTTIDCKVQTIDQQGVTVGGVVVDAPVVAVVRGRLPLRLAEKGMLLKCSARLNLNGKIERPVLQFKHLDQKIPLQQPYVEFFQRPQTNDDFADCEILGRVIAVNHDVVSVEVPPAKWARRSKITIPIDSQSRFHISQLHLKNLQPGDRVSSLEVREFENGERLIKSINATFNPQRSRLTIGINDRLAQEFAHLSKANVPPRTLRSEHFILHTDASDHQSKVLLAKLETMFGLVGDYYSRRPAVPIEVYVVEDLGRWERRKLPPAAMVKISQQTGVTVITNSPRQSRAVVYSCNDDRIVQHESVHAFCVQAFGGLGPVWYAEGMAELGLYFNADAMGVQIDPVVAEFLKTSPPKTVAEIISQPQSTGDTWQQYAWRWAMCHFLSTNQNYRRRFKNLGVRMMTEPSLTDGSSAAKDSNGAAFFDATFARQRQELDFEFAHFLNHLDNGVHAAAMRIQWDRTPKSLQQQQVANQTIKSDRGWQVVGVATQAGQSLDIAIQGQWQTSIDSGPLVARVLVGVMGNSEGRYKMSQPQRIAGKCQFIAPMDGQLVFRCDEGFNQLHDNEGAVEVFVRMSQPQPSSP